MFFNYQRFVLIGFYNYYSGFYKESLLLATPP